MLSDTSAILSDLMPWLASGGHPSARPCSRKYAPHFPRSGERGLPLSVIQGIADEVAQGTFGTHLAHVSDGLPSNMDEIADKINEARNALLHWRLDRFSLPVYKGQDVTTGAGFQTCMDDVLTFIQVVPFNTPTGLGRGHIA